LNDSVGFPPIRGNQEQTFNRRWINSMSFLDGAVEGSQNDHSGYRVS